MQVVGLKLCIEISYTGAENLCVVYETTVGTPIFPIFEQIFLFFSYLFYLEIPIFVLF